RAATRPARAAAAPGTPSRTSRTTIGSCAARWRWRTRARTRTAVSSSSSRPTRAHGSTASTPSSGVSSPGWTSSTRSRRSTGTAPTARPSRSRSSEWSWQRSKRRGCLLRERRAPKQPEAAFERRADPEREDDRADADLPAEREAGTERAELEQSAHGAQAEAGSLASDHHQRVARPRADRRTEVESRTDADHRHRHGEEGDADAERRVREPVDGTDRGQGLDERADERRVRDRPDSDAGTEQPRDQEHDDADTDVRRAEGERRVLRDPLVKGVPGREPEAGLELRDDRRGEDEEADDERDEPGGQPAADARRNVHGRDASDRSVEAYVSVERGVLLDRAVDVLDDPGTVHRHAARS